MKSLWICLPLGLALTCCQPIQRGPADGPDQGKAVLRAGQFARTMIDNTSFFRHLPLGGAQADLLLQRHTAMRVIQLEPGYSKVELDSGEVGFVLTAMLEAIPPKVPVNPDQPDRSDQLDPIPPTPPVGSGVPDLLPPTIEPE